MKTKKTKQDSHFEALCCIATRAKSIQAQTSKEKDKLYLMPTAQIFAEIEHGAAEEAARCWKIYQDCPSCDI